MSQKQHHDALLSIEVWTPPQFPKGIRRLNSLYGKRGWIESQLDEIGRSIEGFLRGRRIPTSDCYVWYRTLIFFRDGGKEIEVAFPYIEGGKAERSIAFYSFLTVSEEVLSKLAEDLSLAFEKKLGMDLNKGQNEDALLGTIAPQFPQGIKRLNTLYDKREWIESELQKIGRSVIGFLAMRTVITSDDYVWCWGLVFTRDGKEIVVAFPSDKDNRSIAFYSTFGEEVLNKLAEDLSLAFEKIM